MNITTGAGIGEGGKYKDHRGFLIKDAPKSSCLD